jgi:recombination protein RecT
MATGQEVSLVKRYEDVRAWFNRPEVKNQLARLAPSHIDVTKVLETAFQVIKENNNLLNCEKRSLIAGIMGGLDLGLSFKKELGQAYLVPFKSKGGSLVATLIIGYRGYITLAKNSGEVTKVSAHAVYANDRFEVEYGTDEKLLHVPSEGDRGDFKGAYCVFFYKDGTTSFEYMGRKTIDAHRSRSKAADSGPWVTDFEEMAVKTTVRHHAKFTPLSTERLAKAADLEERYIEGLPQADLLPDIPEGVSSGEDAPAGGTPPPPAPVVSKFDDLLSSSLKGTPYEGMMIEVDSFLEYLAKKNKVSVSALKVDAANRWEQFSKALMKHLESKVNPKGKEEVKPSQVPPPSAPPAGNVAQPEGSQLPLGGSASKVPTITCPETDSQIDIRTCENCPTKDGCPAQ